MPDVSVETDRCFFSYRLGLGFVFVDVRLEPVDLMLECGHIIGFGFRSIELGVEFGEGLFVVLFLCSSKSTAGRVPKLVLKTEVSGQTLSRCSERSLTRSESREG